MKETTIGTGKRKTPAVVLGCMKIGDMPAAEVGALMEAAMEEGITAFDHADIYGGGKSEEIFGQVLAAEPGLRERIFLQPKCGVWDGFFDFSREYTLESVDGILRRLQTDHLDMLLLYQPDALMEPEEVAEASDHLKTLGKVAGFGVSNMSPIQMGLLEKYLGIPPATDQLQFSAAHTPMLDAGLHVNMASEPKIMWDGGALEYCRLKEMTVQAWLSLQYGYFEGTLLGNEAFGESNWRLKRVAVERSAINATVAIVWILRYPGSMQAVVGTTKPERLRQLVEAGDVRLGREERYEIYQAARNCLPQEARLEGKRNCLWDYGKTFCGAVR